MEDLGLQLEGNVSELTAIARIKPGEYPKDRLAIEIQKQEELLESPGKVKLWLSEYRPGTEITWLTHFKTQDKGPHMTWLDHFRAVLSWAHEKRQDEIRKMRTIHYARWVILDHDRLPGIDGPHLLFTSNFDGTLEGYLEDFAAVDEGPLNLIFGHCVGWPGARPADRFIKYVQRHQHPAGIFYANYPRQTVGEVNRALDWKHRTEKFIKDIFPILRKPSPVKWKKEIYSYLDDLAKPTSQQNP